MRGRRLLFVKLLLVLIIGQSSTYHCDLATNAVVQEGILGQTPDFNWLGVLQVHLHDGDNMQIAVSGIVLIKDRYALANADDVARIPQRIFQSDTLAMFIPKGDTPWYVTLRSRVTHPEYEYTTFNTIAIIELNFKDDEDSPLSPICFPTFANNTSSLYLTGYTDENTMFEKVIYKIQYLEQHVCEEFYNKAGLTDKNRVPTSYLCGYSPYNSTHCVWDNGMVLVSNATGWFTLVGFSVRGPGCAAPARFIDMGPYIPWINSVTAYDEELFDFADYRKQDDDEFKPIHELFTANTSRRDYSLTKNIIAHDFFPYPFDTEKPRMFNIQEKDDGTISIHPFNNTLEMYTKACAAHRVLMYSEIFKVMGTPETSGVTSYKLTMYDLMFKICTCVELSIKCTHRESAVLSFKDTIDFNLGTQLGESGETPEELFRYFPVTERTVKPPVDEPWKTSGNLRPEYLKQKTKSGSVINYDLYIKFKFVGNATLTFQLYANRPEEATTTEESRRRAKIKVPYNEMFWGMKETVRQRVKEPAETKVAEPEEKEHEAVLPSISDASRRVVSPFVLAVGYFSIRNFFLL